MRNLSILMAVVAVQFSMASPAWANNPGRKGDGSTVRREAPPTAPEGTGGNAPSVPAPSVMSGEALVGRMGGKLPTWAERSLMTCSFEANCLTRLADRFSAQALQRWTQYWTSLPDNMRGPLIAVCGTAERNGYQRLQCFADATERLTHSSRPEVASAARRALVHGRAMEQNYAASMQAAGECLVSRAGGDEEKASKVADPGACHPPGDLFAQRNPSDIRYVAAPTVRRSDGETPPKKSGDVAEGSGEVSEKSDNAVESPSEAASKMAADVPPPSKGPTGRDDGTGKNADPNSKGVAESPHREGSRSGHIGARVRGAGGPGGTDPLAKGTTSGAGLVTTPLAALIEDNSRNRRAELAGCSDEIVGGHAGVVPTPSPDPDAVTSAADTESDSSTASVSSHGSSTRDGADGEFSLARFESAIVRLRLDREFQGYRALAERPGIAGREARRAIGRLSNACTGNPGLRNFIQALGTRTISEIRTPEATEPAGNFSESFLRAAAMLRQIDQENAIIMRDFYDSSVPSSRRIADWQRFFTEGWGSAIPCQSLIRGGLFVAASISDAMASSAYTGACRLDNGAPKANSGSRNPTGMVRVTCTAAGQSAEQCRSSCSRADGAPLSDGERMLYCANLPLASETGDVVRDEFGLPVYPVAGSGTGIRTTSIVRDESTADDRCVLQARLLESNLARRSAILGRFPEAASVATVGGRPLYRRISELTDADTPAVRQEVTRADVALFGYDGVHRQIRNWCANPHQFATEALSDPAQVAQLLSCNGRAPMPVPPVNDPALNDRSLPEYCRYARRHVHSMCPAMRELSYARASANASGASTFEAVMTAVDVGTMPLDAVACLSVVGGLAESLLITPARLGVAALNAAAVRASVGGGLSVAATAAEVAVATGSGFASGVARVAAAPVVGLMASTRAELGIAAAFTAFGAGVGAASVQQARTDFASRAARCAGGDGSSCDGLAEAHTALQATEVSTALAPAVGYAILGMVVPSHIPPAFAELSGLMRGAETRLAATRAAMEQAGGAYRSSSGPRTASARRAFNEAISAYRAALADYNSAGARTRREVARFVESENAERLRAAGRSPREIRERRGFVLDEAGERVLGANGRPIRLSEMSPEMARSVVDSAATNALARQVAGAMGRDGVTPEVGAYINDLHRNFVGSHVPASHRVSPEAVIGVISEIHRNGELPAWARNLEEGPFGSGRTRANDAALLEIATLEALRRERGLSDADIEARIRRETEAGGANCRIGG